MSDLAGFLAEVEARSPESLVRVDRPVEANDFEVSAWLALLESSGRRACALFSSVPDVAGRPSAFPLLAGAFSSRRLCALALGADDWRMGLVDACARMERNPVAPVVVPREAAPCRAHVLLGEAADLRRLPAPLFHERDAGPYLTMANVLRSRDGGFYDVTLEKNMIKGPRRLSLSCHAHHHHARIWRSYEEAGERAPVAVVLGHHPAFFLGACPITPWANDDYATIGGFMRQPLRLCASETWGDAFLVPADAEVVVEGELLPGVREPHNPFGEISGHYQEEHLAPVIEVTAITHREAAVVQTIFPGHPDHFNLGGALKEGSLLNAMRDIEPGVAAVHLPDAGCGRFICFVSFRDGQRRDRRKAALLACAQMPNVKLCVLVDDEIDVFNPEEVWWAVATQTRWDRDLSVIGGVQTFRPWLGDAVAVVDATRPDEAEFPLRNRIPEAALRRVAGWPAAPR